jgi:methyl-accepting chemotaxis protein
VEQLHGFFVFKGDYLSINPLRMFKKMFSQISFKIIFFTGLSLLILALLITIPFTYISFRVENRSINKLEETLNYNFDLILQNEVETALSMLQVYSDKIENGELSHDEGIIMAADALRQLRFGIDGYFWADTKEGTNVVLPGRKDVEGTNRYNAVDANGVHYMQLILNNGIKGGGFSEYSFPKKGQTVALPKRSYSKLFEPFGWIIGTGNYVDDIDKIIENERVTSQKGLKNRILMILAVSIITFVLMLSFAYVIGRRISKPIVELSNATNKIADGDLTTQIVVSSHDEVGRLAIAVQKMVAQLSKIIVEIADGSSNVVAASGQMNSASQVLADGASEQAASTEQISTSIQQMVAGIIQNAENANRAAYITEQSEKSITLLKNAFKDTLDAMNQITSKSIIIKDISTQTNLLALNAAVEAARAGESGRGFSVVAGEVRKLSDHTQKAAIDIDTITNNSLETAQHAWDLLEAILPEFQQSNNFVKNISTSSNEQKIGANQINSAIQQLVNVTSQNSAASEELASSSEQLSSQAESLKESIGYFKLG